MTALQVASPLGFCAKCTAHGRRKPSTTARGGDGCCDFHTIERFEVKDSVQSQHLLTQADHEAGEPQVH